MYSSDGDPVWLRSATGTENVGPQRIAIDSEDSVYITGTLANTVTFSDSTLKSTSTTNDIDVFITEYSKSGELLSIVRDNISTGNDGVNGLALVGKDNVMLVEYENLVVSTSESQIARWSAVPDVICYGDSNQNTVCSGHGTCIATDTCNCHGSTAGHKCHRYCNHCEQNYYHIYGTE
jgi:hypothetical protein